MSLRIPDKARAAAVHVLGENPFCSLALPFRRFWEARRAARGCAWKKKTPGGPVAFPALFSQAVCQAREAGGRGAVEPASTTYETSLRGRYFSHKFNDGSGLKICTCSAREGLTGGPLAHQRRPQRSNPRSTSWPIPACPVGQLFPHAEANPERGGRSPRKLRYRRRSGQVIVRWPKYGQAMRQAVPALLRMWPKLSHAIHPPEIKTFMRISICDEACRACEATCSRSCRMDRNAVVAIVCLGAGGTQFADAQATRL